MSRNYDEAKIARARDNWRKTDEATWGKRDEKSMSARNDALLDLLCAHVPLPNEENP